MESAFRDWYSWVWPMGFLGAAVLLALLAHRILFAALSAWARRRAGFLLKSVIRQGRAPLSWLLPLLALLAALPGANLSPNVVVPAQRIVGLALIATAGWLCIVCSAVVFDVVSARYRIDVEDNLAARRVHTQAKVLHRIVVVSVVIVSCR